MHGQESKGERERGKEERKEERGKYERKKERGLEGEEGGLVWEGKNERELCDRKA